MPDWEAIIRSRLQGLGASAEQQAEVASELAGHLEDLYERARIEGLTEQEAAARALAAIGDEAVLRRRISLALRGSEFAADWKSSFWMPALFVTAAHLWFVKLSFWYMLEHAIRYPNGQLILQSPVLPLGGVFFLILEGAMGGLLSWSAGGRFWQRLMAGLSTWLIHPVILVMSALIELAHGHHFYWFGGMSLYGFWLDTLRLCPYLLLGVFPFLLLNVRRPRAPAHA